MTGKHIWRLWEKVWEVEHGAFGQYKGGFHAQGIWNKLGENYQEKWLVSDTNIQ